MEGWTDRDVVFERYSSDRGEGERRMSLFQVKCALLSLFGISVSIVSRIYFGLGQLSLSFLVFSQADIKKHLANLDPDWRITGVTKEHYTSLAAEYNTRSEHEITYEAYKKFDKMNKGFISSAEFKNVVSEVLPHLSSSTVEGIFRAADLYGVNKVSVGVKPVLRTSVGT